MVVVWVGGFGMIGCWWFWLLGLCGGMVLGGCRWWWSGLWLVRGGSIGLVVGGLPLDCQWLFVGGLACW